VEGELHATLYLRNISPLFTLGKGPSYPLDRRVSGLQSGLDTELQGKSFASAGDRTPVVISVVTPCTDCAILALI
jgi:hypothetical protein